MRLCGINLTALMKFVPDDPVAMATTTWKF